MRHFFLLTFLIPAYLTSFAQKSSEPGYYIDTKGNNIQGVFPGSKQWSRNPVEVEFITHDNKPITLTPQNCNSFTIQDQTTYVSYHGPRMISALEDKQVNLTSIPDAYENVPIFLKTIYQNNNVTIYGYRDKTRENFFYKKDEKGIVELEKKLGVYFSNGSRRTNSIDRFKDQLREAFRPQIEDRSLQNRLNTLTYTEKDLVKFMDLLYETKFSKKNNKYPTKIFIGAGAAFNALKIKGDNSYFETQVDHTSPVSPVLVVGAKFIANRTNGRLLISPRISVNSLSAKGDVALTSAGQPFSHESSFKSKLVITPAANLGYNFVNQSALKWYASAGAGFALLVNPKEKQTTNWINGSKTVTENTAENMVFVVNIETGVDIGKNIGIWINYQFPANSMKYVNKSVEFSSLKVGLSWYLITSK